MCAVSTLAFGCGLTERNPHEALDAGVDAEGDAAETRVCISLAAPQACRSEGEACTPGVDFKITRWQTDGSLAPTGAEAVDCFGCYDNTCGDNRLSLAACFDDDSCARVGVAFLADPSSWCGDLVDVNQDTWLLISGCSDLTTTHLPELFEERYQAHVAGTLELDFMSAAGNARHVTFEVDFSVKDFSTCCLC
jgi:hypothetical protein